MKICDHTQPLSAKDKHQVKNSYLIEAYLDHLK